MTEDKEVTNINTGYVGINVSKTSYRIEVWDEECENMLFGLPLTFPQDMIAKVLEIYYRGYRIGKEQGKHDKAYEIRKALEITD